MRGIAEFPAYWKGTFEEDGIEYFGDYYSMDVESHSRFSEDKLWEPADAKWARKEGIRFYDARLDYHWFVMKHLVLGISMEFFE